MTCRASDKCKREKRKTVNGDDILWSMKSLGFDDAVVILQQYLQKIREVRNRSTDHCTVCIVAASVMLCCAGRSLPLSCAQRR